MATPYYMISDLLLTSFLVFLNGFFVAAEFAIVKVRSSQLEVEAKAGNPSAMLARTIVKNIDGYLAATQLGITVASLGLGWIGEPVVAKIILGLMEMLNIHLEEDLLHKIALPIAFFLITVLHIVFGELAPKSLALQRSEQTTLAVAYPLRFFYLLFQPFIWILNGVANVLLKTIGLHASHGAEAHSSEELKYLVLQGKESGSIEEEKFTIIRNAFEFSDRPARQVMVPRSQIFALDIGDHSLADINKLLEVGYSRIPCYEDNLDKIVGVIYLKDLLNQMREKQSTDISTLLRPIMAIPENKPIGRLLRDFQVKHQQIALVVDEFGATKGIITMEDILEELVGEIQDEHDEEVPPLTQLSENSWQVQAAAAIHDINKILPFPIPEAPDYETLAGYLLFKCDRIPHQGEKIYLAPYLYTIVRKIKSSLTLVKVELQAEPTEENV